MIYSLNILNRKALRESAFHNEKFRWPALCVSTSSCNAFRVLQSKKEVLLVSSSQVCSLNSTQVKGKPHLNLDNLGNIRSIIGLEGKVAILVANS